MRLGNAGLSRYGSNQVRTGPKSQPALPEKAAGTQPVSNGEGRGRAAVLAAKAACLSEAEATWPLQRMLLESVANGSIALPEDIDRFVSRTLASHSGQHVRMQRAARAALQSLRNAKLLSYRSLKPELPPVWNATPKGLAVHASGLPSQTGQLLYERLKQTIEGPIALTTQRSGCSGPPLQLIFALLMDHPFSIDDWGQWDRLHRRMHPTHQKVGILVGVQGAYIMCRCSGGRADEAQNALHARFAAACALSDLLSEQPVQQVIAKWGQEKALTQQGVTAGQLQQLQLCLAEWAGMAANMCASFGWWQLETLLAAVAQQAAAGARAELLNLMQVPDMTAARARSLYDSGIRTVAALATKEQDAVVKALAAGLPKHMRMSKQVSK
eukprot:jgi/Astpho2/9373/Aster-x0392